MTDAFPFVVGCGRSGTTLLRAMLDAHPALAVTPESYFVVPALRAHGRRLDLPALLDEVLRTPSFAEWGLEPELVRAAVAAAAPTDAGEALAAIYRAYAQARGAQIAADKTPYHVVHLRLLAEQIPHARFVHLIRDGRDVAASLVGMDFGPSTFPQCAAYWRRHVQEGRAGGRRLGPGRYAEVRYEDLVAEPERELRRLCGFLGLDFDDGMLRYWERANTVLAGLRRDAHLQGVRRPPTVGVRSWRNNLAPADVALFEAIAGDVLSACGYERSARLSPGLRAVGAAHRASAAAVRVGKRARARARRAQQELRTTVARRSSA